MDSKINSTSTTLKSNPLINTSTTVINNSNVDSRFLFSSNFESNHHRDFHFFTDSQGNTFTTRGISPQQSLIHSWVLPIFSLPTPPQSHHFSIQSNFSNTNIFMSHVMPRMSAPASSNDIPTTSGNITFTQPLDNTQSKCLTSNSNYTTSSQRNSNSVDCSTKNRHVCNWPGCTWSFKRLEHLKRHMITHTGERKYACSYPGCGKKFGRSDNFAAHYRTHNKTTSRKSRGMTKSRKEKKLNNCDDTSGQLHNNNNEMNGLPNDMNVNDVSIPQDAVSQKTEAASSFCDGSKDNN